MTPTTRRLFLSTFLALLLQSSLPSVTEAFSLKMNSYLDNLGRNNHHPNRGSSSEDGASPAHQQQRGSQSQQQQQEQGYSPGFGMPPVNMPPMPPPQQQQQPLKDIDNIFRQNQVWKGSKLNEDPNFFQTLGSNHKPTYMWIGELAIFVVLAQRRCSFRWFSARFLAPSKPPLLTSRLTLSLCAFMMLLFFDIISHYCQKVVPMRASQPTKSWVRTQELFSWLGTLPTWSSIQVSDLFPGETVPHAIAIVEPWAVLMIPWSIRFFSTMQTLTSCRRCSLLLIR